MSGPVDHSILGEFSRSVCVLYRRSIHIVIAGATSQSSDRVNKSGQHACESCETKTYNDGGNIKRKSMINDREAALIQARGSVFLDANQMLIQHLRRIKSEPCFYLKSTPSINCHLSKSMPSFFSSQHYQHKVLNPQKISKPSSHGVVLRDLLLVLVLSGMFDASVYEILKK